MGLLITPILEFVLPFPWFSKPGWFRVATAQGKQGIWSSVFPDRENTGNLSPTQGKSVQHREKIGSFLDVGLSTYRFKYRFKLRDLPGLW